MSGKALIGMVDQRFDHIDSGKFSGPDPRRYLRWPSVIPTWRPQYPKRASSRTESAVPSISGSSDLPWLGWATEAPNRTALVGGGSTGVAGASRSPAGRPGQRT